jgi:hypothetical protein
LFSDGVVINKIVTIEVANITTIASVLNLYFELDGNEGTVNTPNRYIPNNTK